MTNLTPAEVFPPGEFLREELEARGWSQTDFAEIIGRPHRVVNEVISGKRSITPETARGFGEALGTGAEFWMNLESAYKLSQVESNSETKSISRRAKLYTYPIRDMVRRGWIDDTSNIDVLEHQLTSFFGVDTIEEVPYIDHAARKANYDGMSPAQVAWLFRVRQLAEILTVEKFSEKKLSGSLDSLRMLLHEEREIREIPRLLAEAGVRYLAVEALPGSKIDGVCFWLDTRSPVIAMALRFDRIDNFWFVLRHEIEHVLRGDGKSKDLHEANLDWELEGERASSSSSNIKKEERYANMAAAEFCVPDEEIRDFIARKGPYYSANDILNFAKRINVHPGMVVGQLQFRNEVPFTHFKKHLVKVRNVITETVFADGWGYIPRIKST